MFVTISYNVFRCHYIWMSSSRHSDILILYAGTGDKGVSVISFWLVILNILFFNKKKILVHNADYCVKKDNFLNEIRLLLFIKFKVNK